MKNILNCLFWLVLKLTGIDCSFNEVEANTYEPQATPDHIKSIASPSEIHFEIAKASFERQEKRNQNVLEKAKSLITLAGLLMSVLLATSIAGRLMNGAWLPLLLLLISLVVLLTALIVLARVLSIGNWSEPCIDQDLAKAKPQEASKLYLGSILVATNRNWAANDFLVDVYRAANRLMLLGMALATAAMLVALVYSTQK